MFILMHLEEIRINILGGFMSLTYSVKAKTMKMKGLGLFTHLNPSKQWTMLDNFFFFFLKGMLDNFLILLYHPK